ncbi:MAG TPA: oligosaccharide flippase family protein [Capillimicrobium sp.]|nr:oligosaccharide flippase family protein [Capillimicrobium sp.]
MLQRVSDVLDSREAGPAALRGSALRSGAYLAGVALSIASAPLLIRHLGVAEFGAFVTVMSLMNLVAGVTEGGLNAIALREYATLRGEERRRALRALLGIRWALSLGGVAVGVLFAVVAGYDSPLVVGAIGAGAGVVLQALQQLVATPLQGELRFGWLAALQLLGQVLTVALIVVLVLADAGVVPFLWITVPIGAVLLGATLALVGRAMPVRPSLRWAEVWPLLRDTLPYTAAVALNVVYFRVTILVMSLQAGELETGYFATSFRVIEVLLGIPALVIGAAYPILARAERDDADRFRYAMRRILELALILGVWMAMCCVVGAQVAIDVLAGDEGQPAVSVLRIQGLTLAATGIGVACGYGLLTLRRYGALLWLNLGALAMAVVLTLVLVPAAGAEGAAVATFGAELALTVGLLVALLRARPELAGGLTGAPLIVAVAAVAVAIGLLTGLPALVALVVANVAFVAGLVVVRRFPPEVWDVVRR